MKLDCNPYRRTLNSVRERLLEKCAQVGARQAAGELACYTHMPLAVVVCFLMLPENLGPTKDLTLQLESLIKFYKYEEIVPFMLDS